jgi:hypothetical protein
MCTRRVRAPQDANRKMGLLVLMGVAGLAVAIIPYVARPGPSIFALGLCAIVVFASRAIWCNRKVEGLNRLAQAQFYSLPTDTEGTRELHVQSTPGLHGVAAHLVPKGSREYSFGPETLPFPGDRIRECNWAIRLDGAEHLRGWQCNQGRPWLDDGCLASYVGVRDSGQEIIFEYEVNERTRPVLESLDLAVGYDWGFGNDLAMGGAAWAAECMGLVALAVVNGGGLVVAFVKARRRRVQAA